MTQADVEHVIVTVDERHIITIQLIVNSLKLMGMKITNVLPVTGVITGSIASTARPLLQTVPGVVSVELDQDMQAI